MQIDVRTIILMLAIGSFVFGLLLVIFQYHKESSEWIPIWIAAKFLQGLGSLILYFRVPSPEFMTVFTGNNLVLLGCAYEGWAVFYITGRVVNRRLQHCLALSIVILFSFMFLLKPSIRLVVIFFLHTVFYFLPAWALLRHNGQKSLLRSFLSLSFLLLSVLFFTRTLWVLLVPEQSYIAFDELNKRIMPLAVFCMILISGFSMLLLANEKSYFELHEAQQELKNLNKKLEILSNTDGLTNIANRRYLDERLILEYNRLSRRGAQLSLIMIDIDYFKLFNDHYGHVCGDDCLRQVASVISNNISRSADVAARYGGEEFVCILPETDLKGAKIIAERIRIDVENLFIEHQQSKISNFVTISLGVSTIECCSRKNTLDILSMADNALYKAKMNGRNRTEVYIKV
ncbi:MAG: diguanylate cyclase [Desulfamplus sp.]|nr:diguanylate cyclase [Desulfamplus sp.]